MLLPWPRSFSETLRSSETTGALAALHIDHANVGCVNLKRGEYKLALCHFQKALEIARAVKDQISMAKWLHNLSLTYKSMGDPIQAINYELEAERVNRQVAEARASIDE